MSISHYRSLRGCAPGFRGEHANLIPCNREKGDPWRPEVRRGAFPCLYIYYTHNNTTLTTAPLNGLWLEHFTSEWAMAGTWHLWMRYGWSYGAGWVYCIITIIIVVVIIPIFHQSCSKSKDIRQQKVAEKKVCFCFGLAFVFILMGD